MFSTVVNPVQVHKDKHSQGNITTFRGQGYPSITQLPTTFIKFPIWPMSVIQYQPISDPGTRQRCMRHDVYPVSQSPAAQQVQKREAVGGKKSNEQCYLMYGLLHITFSINLSLIQLILYYRYPERSLYITILNT